MKPLEEWTQSQLIRMVKRLQVSQEAWLKTAISRGKVIEKINRISRRCGEHMVNGLKEKMEEILDEYEKESDVERGIKRE